MKLADLLIIMIIFMGSCKQPKPKELFFKDKDSGVIYNQQELDKHKAEFINIFKQQVANEITLHEIYTDTIETVDSLIITFKLMVVLEQEKEKINSFLHKEFPLSILKEINNKNFDLTRLKGKPTLINIWKTNCKPCIEEMPALNKLRNKFLNRVNFISITVDNDSIVTRFLKSHEFDFIKIVSATDFLDELDVRFIPKNIVLDKDGIVQAIKGSVLSSSADSKNKKIIDELEEEINKLL